MNFSKCRVFGERIQTLHMGCTDNHEQHALDTIKVKCISQKYRPFSCPKTRDNSLTYTVKEER